MLEYIIEFEENLAKGGYLNSLISEDFLDLIPIIQSYNCPCCLGPLVYLLPKFKHFIWLSNLFTMSVPSEGVRLSHIFIATI